MTDNSNADEEVTRKEILTAARAVLAWRRLAVERRGARWLVTRAGGRGNGQQWEAVLKLDGSGWWFFKETR